MRTFLKIVRFGKQRRRKMATGRRVYELLRREARGLDREYLWRLDLDPHDGLIAYERVAIGSVSKVIAEPREIFKGAILNGASSIVLVHNHPSQHVRPSEADRTVTARVMLAGALLGIGLRDHLVICDSNFFSYRESGQLNTVAKDMLPGEIAQLVFMGARRRRAAEADEPVDSVDEQVAHPAHRLLDFDP